MITRMRQTHEKQGVGGVELIKVVKDEDRSTETQQTAPKPIISNTTKPEKGTSGWEEVRWHEINK